MAKTKSKKIKRFTVEKLSKDRKMNLGKKWTHLSLLSQDEITGLMARNEARKAGRKAAVAEAKRRASVKNKTPMTQKAVMFNASAEKLRNKANKIRNAAGKELMAKATPRQFRKMTGMRKKNIVIAGTPGRMLELKGHLPEVTALRERAELQKSISKDYARSSGGHATAIKRNAAKASALISKGRQMKGLARSHGIYGLAASWLSGEIINQVTKKKRG